MSVKGISVIIPNYNGKFLLAQIIPPLIEALNNVKLAFEIIVADDCSTDESISYLDDVFKQVIVLQNTTNSGFSKTINKGIFAARNSHLLLLNNDVKLNSDYFVHLLHYFDKPDTFGVTGRIIGWDNDAIQDGGKYPYFHGAKIKTSGNYVPLHYSEGSWLYSMYLPGSNAFVDREKILQLKGFDEIFSPYYVEDFELSLRAWRLGWKCYYEHSAVCRHRTSSTIRSYKKSKVSVIYNRNKMYLHAIHLNGAQKLLWYIQLAGEFFLRMITLRWYYLKALLQFKSTRQSVSASRERFKELSLKTGTLLPVKQVVAKIKESLAPIKKRRF